MGGRIRKDLKRERKQRVAGENSGRFVELAMHGRAPAPEIVVVHGGQVVVDQRITVRAFDRHAGAQRRFARDAEGPRGFDGQEGP